MFHVWASDLADPASVFPWKDPSEYPLTDKAKQALAKWDPIRDTVARGCEPKGMPTIIEQPYPIDFVDQHDTILLRMEEYDTVRTLQHGLEGAGTSQPKNAARILLRVTGKVRLLVVETSRIELGLLGSERCAAGRRPSVVEQFTPSADGSRLNYTMVVTDSETFTRPVELHRVWVRRPGEEVKPYNCASAKARATHSRRQPWEVGPLKSPGSPDLPLDLPLAL